MIQKNEEFGTLEKNWHDSEKTESEPVLDRTLECFHNRLYTFQKCLENHLDARLYLSSVHAWFKRELLLLIDQIRQALHCSIHQRRDYV